MGIVASYLGLLPKGIWYAISSLWQRRSLSDEARRRILDDDPTLETVTRKILDGEYSQIIVLTGAGISTAAGIPDFRSSRGFYANVERYNLNSPMDIFSLSFFKSHPEPFLELAKSLLPREGTFGPTFSHHFIRLLHEKGLLLRVWTQNVDGLEAMSGIPMERIVEAHGHVRAAHCVVCHSEFSMEDFKEQLRRDDLPIRCRRSVCRGLVKPDVTFFGEALPARALSLAMSDFRSCDLLLVIGTSLAVYPFAGLVERVGVHVPRILFNMECVGPFRRTVRDEDNYRDVFVEGKCDPSIAQFVCDLGWEDEIEGVEEALAGTERPLISFDDEVVVVAEEEEEDEGEYEEGEGSSSGEAEEEMSEEEET